MKLRFLIISCLCCSLYTGCSSFHSTPQPVDTSDLNSLQNMSASTDEDDTEAISDIRAQGLQGIALTFGAQSGLATRSKIINANLEKQAKYMRNVFNFGALMLEHNVLPPVLVQSSNSLNYAGDNVIRVSDKTYKIVQQAKFTTTAPTWRNYVFMNYSKPQMPHKTLLPKTKAEQKIWRKYIKIGWENGVTQANTIFNENLARLKRDYNGMLLYRELLAKHMISKPYVAKTDLGITGDANTMNINDQVLRITSTPQLQTDSRQWQPILVERQ